MEYNQDIDGYKTYRHESNPEEKKFHDNFKSHIKWNPDTMDNIALPLMTVGVDKKEPPLTEREKRIMLSTIQWLGSSVGQTFLRDSGYTEDDEEETICSTKLWAE
jgi:hypothetical protein